LISTRADGAVSRLIVPHKLHFIVRVMREVELCCMLNKSSYVVSQLLPANSPEL
jgi:hypothetical protein